MNPPDVESVPSASDAHPGIETVGVGPVLDLTEPPGYGRLLGTPGYCPPFWT